VTTCRVCTLCEWLKLPSGPTVHTVRITRGDHVCGWQPLMSAMEEVAKRVCPASASRFRPISLVTFTTRLQLSISQRPRNAWARVERRLD
jgi:hypothetical protein